MRSPEAIRRASRKWKEKNPNYSKNYYLLNKDRINSMTANYYRKNKEAVRKYNQAYRIKSQYGITVDAYQYLLDKQGGKCAICEQGNGLRRLCVDHCHETGAVRGLLCTGCNSAIGKLDDNPNLLRKAASYLERAI